MNKQQKAVKKALELIINDTITITPFTPENSNVQGVKTVTALKTYYLYDVDEVLNEVKEDHGIYSSEIEGVILHDNITFVRWMKNHNVPIHCQHCRLDHYNAHKAKTAPTKKHCKCHPFAVLF